MERELLEVPAGQFKVRRMNRKDVGLAMEWAAREGWNPGLTDGECFYDTDPNGFFLGELSGEPVGCVSAVAYDDTFGFIGLYIVRPEYRGKGYGIRLWDAAMGSLGDRNVGLDGVLAQQGNYERSGFRLAYKNLRYKGIIRGKVSDRIVKLDKVPFDDLVSYDSGVFPAARPGFLKCWIAQPRAAAYGYLDGGALAGYGVIRECGTGYKIGPLFSDSEEAAEGLLNALASKAPDEPIYLDVPELNAAAISMAMKQGMEVIFETVRMYTKKPYLSQLQKVFGVTTFELG